MYMCVCMRIHLVDYYAQLQNIFKYLIVCIVYIHTAYEKYYVHDTRHNFAIV